MVESSIQVSKRRLEALYTQFEENKNKIIDSSLQSKIQRSGSFTDVLSIISKFELKKTEVEVESKYLEEAKQNYIQALSKYDKKTIEALKEIGNVNEEFNGFFKLKIADSPQNFCGQILSAKLFSNFNSKKKFPF